MIPIFIGEPDLNRGFGPGLDAKKSMQLATSLWSAVTCGFLAVAWHFQLADLPASMQGLCRRGVLPSSISWMCTT